MLRSETEVLHNARSGRYHSMLMGWTTSLRNGIARASIALVGLMLLGLAILSIKDSVREQSRLRRLRTEGVAVIGTIVRVDVERQHPSNANGREDRTRWEYFRMATVRYAFGGRTYVPDHRHYLTGRYEAAQVGDAYPLLLLPDLPDKPYAPDAIVGSWIAVFAQPVLLVLTAALCFFGAAFRPFWSR